MGNMQFGDRQNVNQDVTLAIENVIENTITTENMNRAVADQVSIQGVNSSWMAMIVEKRGYQLESRYSCPTKRRGYTTAIADSIASSDVLNKLHAAASGNAKSENTGLAELVTSFSKVCTAQ